MIFSLVDHPDSTPHRSFWQSEAWKKILTHSGQAEEVFYYGNLVSALLVEIRSIGLGQRAAFILGVDSGSLTPGLVDSLVEYLKQKNLLFLHIEPLVSGTEDSTTLPISWYKSFLVGHTRIINLDKSLDIILEQMHEKGRYNIRLAEKRGVVVEKVSPTKDNLAIAMRLIRETTDRDGFAANSEKYYQSFLDILELEKMGGLYFAQFEGRVIALSIAVYTPERGIYYYGASSTDKDSRKQMAPYLLQWQMIQDAKKAGCKIYDFLGIADPDNSNDSLIGVSSFKEKFGGEIVMLPEKKIIPLSWKCWIFRGVYIVRKILKK